MTSRVRFQNDTCPSGRISTAQPNGAFHIRSTRPWPPIQRLLDRLYARYFSNLGLKYGRYETMRDELANANHYGGTALRCGGRGDVVALLNRFHVVATGWMLLQRGGGAKLCWHWLR